MACAQERELYRTEHDNLPYYFGIYLAYNNTYLHPDKHPKFYKTTAYWLPSPVPRVVWRLAFWRHLNYPITGNSGSTPIL